MRGMVRRLQRGQGRISQSVGILLVCRLVLAGAVLIAGRSFLEVGTEATSLLYVAAAIVAVTGMYVYLLWRTERGLPLFWLQIWADLIVVSWVVGLTGGHESPFLLLYFVSIILAGYFTLVKGGVAAAMGAVVGLCAVTLPPALAAGEGQVSSVAVQCATDSVFFLLVGALGGYLGHGARAHEKGLEEAKSELERMKLDTEYILRSMGSGLLTIDNSETILHFNPTAAAILQVKEESARGARLEVLEEAGLVAFVEVIRRTLTTKRGIPRREIELELPDGRTVPVGVSTSVIRGDEGECRGAIAVFQDLTDVREMELRARSNETLAAVGQLAAAVAHEIRNCLSPISGSVDVLVKELKLEGDNKKLLDLIVRETKQLEGFVNSLLDYARVKPLSVEEVDLEAVLGEALETVRRHPNFKHEICVQMSQKASELKLVADRGQLRQAFVNIGNNAVEAMPEGGMITVTVSYRGPTGVGRGGAAVIEFADTGEGIPTGKLSKIFEPFFTTKSKGTGLGLAVVRQAVERHGGTISVESEPGQGTCVRLEIPCQAGVRLMAA